MKKAFITAFLIVNYPLSIFNCQLSIVNCQTSLLETGWKFFKVETRHAVSLNGSAIVETNNYSSPHFNDSKWQSVVVPHDWAIYGPFDASHDAQTVAISQNGEQQASAKTGRTGSLPYTGVGWYRTHFDVPDFVPDSSAVSLLFDGAMSEAQVFVNGQKVGSHPYGYNSFHFDITPFLNTDGKNNLLAVRLENRPESSRWYPGAGLYRNVHLIVKQKVHIPVWGTFISTTHLSEPVINSSKDGANKNDTRPVSTAKYATVNLKIEIANAEGREVEIHTEIINRHGKVVAWQRSVGARFIAPANELGFAGALRTTPLQEQNFLIEKPHLWTPEKPCLYHAVTKVFVDKELSDTYTTRFGIRDVKIVPHKGFFLNGTLRKFQGVCNHHDLGALGAAVNVAALRRQLTLLKDMGCDAIRTAHNMPAPELVELCDEMGFMMIVEPFDEWDIAKCKNGYHRFFTEWAKKDMVNMLHHYRNNPSVVMWSIGNEVPTQGSPQGYRTAQYLQDICHAEDPTRPVTCGMDQADKVMNNGFAAQLDVVGFNYRLHKYLEAYDKLPQKLLLGTETASTVSARGVYKFPVEKKAGATYPDNQCSAYDLEHCWWSNIPDEDFRFAEDYDWTMGQFVWTGFDYLGEPTPYDGQKFNNHSSMFGIIDLATIPKDRYYLYRSVWNQNKNTLHLLPHWTFPDRNGLVTPVFVYTNFPSAELFINGKSQGKKHKTLGGDVTERYRLMWSDTKYEAGELKVIAYDHNGKIAETKIIHTAGKPSKIALSADRSQLIADGKDLSYITVSVLDKDGNECPNAQDLITFKVSGAGTFRAAANGDATCLDLFHVPQMHLFNGKLVAIVQSGQTAGTITFEAKAKGIKSEQIEIISL